MVLMIRHLLPSCSWSSSPLLLPLSWTVLLSPANAAASLLLVLLPPPLVLLLLLFLSRPAQLNCGGLEGVHACSLLVRVPLPLCYWLPS